MKTKSTGYAALVSPWTKTILARASKWPKPDPWDLNAHAKSFESGAQMTRDAAAELMRSAADQIRELMDVKRCLVGVIERAAKRNNASIEAMTYHCNFRVGQQVEKFTGDYTLRGEVRAIFTKRNGVPRIVVEHEPGFLHIYAPENLRDIEERNSHEA